ncbi:twin-arginine translocation signal domain-containing protein [uncultured Halopseudomonas sp.]|uniref:twin-arginine translocation signal domain-containing protein n=1 Tax=uncultured Halopseudomonas sp. TaxID=2901193 RepID=UPI0030EB3A83|tara:strand:- start:14755 stop:15288 length:534 start_codon:yes stop_codon:yes gene_type:complete
MTSLSSAPLNRRQFLKLGAGASAALATVGMTATLSGCSSSRPGVGYSVLRDTDIPVVAAIMVGLVGPHPALNQDTLQAAIDQFDTTLAWTSTAVQTQVTDLLGMLSMPITRGPMTGIWGTWDKASPAEVQAFLQRWRDSRLDMLRQGHSALSQLLLMAWYATPASWAAIGYPGPPVI